MRAAPVRAAGKVAKKTARKKATTPKEAGDDSTIARLARMGLRRAIDCVLHLPLRYEDETHIVRIADLQPGESGQVEVRVVKSEIQYRGRRQLIVEVEDQSGSLTLRFLHFYGSQVKHFEPGQLLRVRGELRGGILVREMIHPRYNVIRPGEALPDRLTPVYPASEGVSQTLLRAAIKRALASADLADTLPAELVSKLDLWTFERAVRTLHNPSADADIEDLLERRHPAWRRVKFDELLAQQLSLQRARLLRRSRQAIALTARGKLTDALLRMLPFTLTGAQKRVWSEIASDLSASYPMQRLLQGDVGSGKTIIAALAALRAIENGTQAALMAPTEILAEQHFAKISEWLSALGIHVVWLTGRIKKSERSTALCAIEDGRAQLVIGTHALIQESIGFRQLGLAIVDEQHRFGVDQRLALGGKGGAREPHQLMMSATPIPRTLAMTYFADLEVSTIDELPPGRQPITTKLFASSRREQVVAGVAQTVKAGGQAYWVCPLIEESETLELKTAVETFEALRKALPELSIGLCHGRLSSADKAQVMEGFYAGSIDVLVATTVIEVGVDVPNASLMVIEHAERFGLSQMHQLRGRIGRGRDASTCILMYQAPLSNLAKERLRIIKESADGFELARRDLELRGPGEFLGQRQSGVALLRFADLLHDQSLLEQARDAALELLRDTSGPVERHLHRWLGDRAEYLKA